MKRRTVLSRSSLGLLSLAWLGASRAAAQDCGCDHAIGLDQTIVDGDALGVGPGDVICIAAGHYEFLRFRSIVGTEADPVVIRNCGGLVEVRNLDRAYSVVFEDDSSHFHLTGSGSPDATYGFRVSAPDRDPYPGMGLWMLGRSTDYEIDHVEVHDTGFAGVVAKTDPLCDGSADQGVFVQRNVHLHHLYVHDTGGEGFYVGSTQSSGQTITCDGTQEVHQPHFLEGIEIDHVLVEDTHWDGMQVGMAHAGCSVHDNVIRRVGLDRVLYQQQLLQIGTYSRCDVRRNVFLDGPANGVFVLGAYDTTVADNVIARVGEHGVYANLGDAIPTATYRFVHNTILRFGEGAITLFGPTTTGNVAWNNFVVGEPGDVSAGGGVPFDASGNVFAASEAEAEFARAGDYYLGEDSPARGAGIDRSAQGFALDRDSEPRANPPSAGAYEYRASLPDVDPIDGARGDEGGCSCRTAGAPTPGAWIYGALGLALVGMRMRLRGTDSSHDEAQPT